MNFYMIFALTQGYMSLLEPKTVDEAAIIYQVNRFSSYLRLSNRLLKYFFPDFSWPSFALKSALTSFLFLNLQIDFFLTFALHFLNFSSDLLWKIFIFLDFLIYNNNTNSQFQIRTEITWKVCLSPVVKRFHIFLLRRQMRSRSCHTEAANISQHSRSCLLSTQVLLATCSIIKLRMWFSICEILPSVETGCK